MQLNIFAEEEKVHKTDPVCWGDGNKMRERQ